MDKLTQEFLSLVKVEGFEERYQADIGNGLYFGMPIEPIINAEKKLLVPEAKKIAYFSMEYGLATSFYNKFLSNRPVSANNQTPENAVFSNSRVTDYFFALHNNNIIDLPIYSGGLGVLAGDTVKTMADYKLPAAAVGILWNSGYFRQRFWFKYGQAPEKMQWDPYTYPGLIPLEGRVEIFLKPETVYLKIWKYYVYSYKRDYAVALILLDSNIEENSQRARGLTDQLYRSDNVWIKILQRVILGYGGVAALNKLGYKADLYHMNEGHAVFSFVEKARGLTKQDAEKLKDNFVYTCHTPVEAGHDRFYSDDLRKVLKEEDVDIIERYGRERPGLVNLTLMAMNVAASTNAVSRNHQRVMHLQFPKYKERIKYVTNGVHPHTWISDSFRKLFEKYNSVFTGIDSNPMILAKATELRKNNDFRRDLWLAHQENKTEGCSLLEKWKISPDVFTICWARRIAAYKRPSLILHDVKRLIDIAGRAGPMQIVLAGKAHPNDNLGFTYINEMLDTVDKLGDYYDFLKIIVLENYGMYMGKMLTSCSDVWLNNPLPPFEASGTSGMKAILNGVLQMSTIDGWVAEAADRNMGAFFGYRNNETDAGNENDLHIVDDAEALYSALEGLVKLYYRTNNRGKVELSSAWLDMMIECLCAGGEFNTYRMLDQYKHDIWNIA